MLKVLPCHQLGWGLAATLLAATSPASAQTASQLSPSPLFPTALPAEVNFLETVSPSASRSGEERLAEAESLHRETSIAVSAANFEFSEPLPGEGRWLAQSDVSSEEDKKAIEELRQELQVEPLLEKAELTYPPSLNPGIPSAFGAQWGDFFAGVSGSTSGNLTNNVDASIVLGLGLGDRYKALGLEWNYNLLSIDGFADNGSFDLKAHRVVYASREAEVAVAVGWANFANYGGDAGGTPSGVYGEVTGSFLAMPDNPDNQLPILVSFGVGGGPLRDSESGTSTSPFGGIGVGVHPQVGISAGWSGRGLNLQVSGVPVPTIPLTLNALVADVTDRTANGTVFVFTVGYGLNIFQPF